MKKIIFGLIILYSLTFISCSEDEYYEYMAFVNKLQSIFANFEGILERMSLKLEDFVDGTKETKIIKIDWNNPNSPITTNFTVGEATRLRDWNIYHIPNEIEKQNIIRLATAIQKVRESYGSSMNINGWIRPTSVNAGVLNSSGIIVRDPQNQYHGKNYNSFKNGHSNSPHISGLGVDIADGNRSLSNFLLRNQTLLASYNLWMENETITTTWVHLDLISRSTSGRPAGRERIFNP